MQTESVNNSVVYEPLAGSYKLRFDDDVVHPSYYRFEIEALQRATENDIVSITINTDGGSLATGIEFTNEILQCKAPVHGTLRANCHSCGSIVFLACDTHEVGIASEMLLHSGLGGTGGTPAQSVKRAESYKRQIRALFETVYKGFVTDEELDLMIEHDKEYIFSADEIKDRLSVMYSYRQGQKQSAMEDMFSQQNEQSDKYENLLLKTLVDQGKISQEEADIALRVRDATVILDEEEGESVFETLSCETGNNCDKEKVICQFSLDSSCRSFEVGGYTIEYVLEGDGVKNIQILDEHTYLLVDEIDLPDAKALAEEWGIKYPHNIKNENLIKKVVKYFEDLVLDHVTQ